MSALYEEILSLYVHKTMVALLITAYENLVKFTEGQCNIKASEKNYYKLQ